MMQKLNYFDIRLENTTKIIQHGSKVNYAKIFFTECASSQTQQSSNFDEKGETSL